MSRFFEVNLFKVLQAWNNNLRAALVLCLCRHVKITCTYWNQSSVRQQVNPQIYIVELHVILVCKSSQQRSSSQLSNLRVECEHLLRHIERHNVVPLHQSENIFQFAIF